MKVKVIIALLFALCAGITHAEVTWPSGTYGLPMPVSGCPDDETVSWKKGWTYHDTEDDNNQNQRSEVYHMPGNFSKHGIQQKFCIKDTPKGGSEFWPEGKYCIYKKGVCPANMKDGYVRWDDEQSEIDLNDKHQGDLPDGVYDKSHTTINYCCSTKGNVNNPIQLPALKPFYLLTYGSAQCQKVSGTKVTSEFIKFDDDDEGNTDYADGAHPYGPSEDPFNLKIYYCYYEPVTWPSGTYGLPMPVSGCPDDETVSWKKGWTYHDTEDDNNQNQRSEVYHMPGNFSKHGIQQKFCIKDTPKGGSEFWPEGKYCIYKKGVCPANMKDGYVRWDDEQSEIDLNDKHQGDLPDGVYDKSHTTINYCCSTKGNVNNPIQLPALKPFYLLTYGSAQCQKLIVIDDAGDRSLLHDDGSSVDVNDGYDDDFFFYDNEEGYEVPTGKSSSGFAVAIGCGVAGAIVGTASIAFATKRILAHKARAVYDAVDPQPDGP
ncbi:predicted protein [Nematostella vectensis]|uniref:Apextrin C-terminal domain-containing protein n=1 Tax=Nematostella vectensis TaxID=45351 RepID=A7SRB8_NEMVE|nr:predicted protein [Nematostella vectensis]|eukprot:XP_001625852.1 predicted protein [Nematostella vectensis]